MWKSIMWTAMERKGGFSSKSHKAEWVYVFSLHFAIYVFVEITSHINILQPAAVKKTLSILDFLKSCFSYLGSN